MASLRHARLPWKAVRNPLPPPSSLSSSRLCSPRQSPAGSRRPSRISSPSATYPTTGRNTRMKTTSVSPFPLPFCSRSSFRSSFISRHAITTEALPHGISVSSLLLLLLLSSPTASSDSETRCWERSERREEGGGAHVVVGGMHVRRDIEGRQGHVVQVGSDDLDVLPARGKQQLLQASNEEEGDEEEEHAVASYGDVRLAGVDGAQAHQVLGQLGGGRGDAFLGRACGKRVRTRAEGREAPEKFLMKAVLTRS
eukprot:764384-Hanusia_phi.AAC.1